MMAFFDEPEARQLNFVQRYLYPDNYPVIPNEDGSFSTHRMASGEFDGRYIAYPTIVQIEDGELRELEDEEAFDHAVSSGEFIEFYTPKQAQKYAENGYKKKMGEGALRDAYDAALENSDAATAFDARNKARKLRIDISDWP